MQLKKHKQFSGRRGRSCVISHVNVGCVGTLAYNSFRWRSIRLFNSLPMHLRSVLRLKTQLDIFLGPFNYLCTYYCNTHFHD